MRFSWLRLFLITPFLTLALALACGGGGSSTPLPPALEPPVGFSEAAGQNFDQVILTWSPSPSAVEGYELEARQGDGAFQKIHQGMLPATTVAVTLDFNQTTPECQVFSFRVRSVSQGRFSPYTPECQHRRGIRPATLSAVRLPLGARVSWTSASLVNPDPWLERSSDDGVNWTAISPAWSGDSGAIASADDLEAAESEHYRYRVTLKKSGFETRSNISSEVLPQVSAPGEVELQIEGSQVRLRWKNYSRIAQRVVIYRNDLATPIATLPAGSTSYTDQVPQPGYYRYGLSAETSGVQAGLAPWCAAVIAPGNPGPTLLGTELSCPRGKDYQRAPDGTWSILAQEHLWTQASTGWLDHALSRPPLRSPSPVQRLDSQGKPHLIYATPASSGNSELIYEWFDGSTWKSETIAERNIQQVVPEHPLALALSGDGKPLAAWLRGDGFGSGRIEWAYKADANWRTGAVGADANTLGDPSFLRVAVGKDESLHLFFDLGKTLRWWRILPDGSTESEDVISPGTSPDSAPYLGKFDCLVLDAQNATLAVESSTAYDLSIKGFSYALWLHQKNNGSWAAPICLGLRPHDAYPTVSSPLLARSWDGTQAAVIYHSALGNQLHLFRDQVWLSTLLPADEVSNWGVGFKQDGLVGLLLNPSQREDITIPHRFYQEPSGPNVQGGHPGVLR